MTRRRHDEGPDFSFDAMPPILSKDMTQKNYIEALKQSRWNNDYSHQYFKNYFGVEQLDQLLYARENVTLANSLVLRYIFPEFVESKGLKIDRILAIGSEGESPAEFSNIDVAFDKTESRLNYGDFFISNDTMKFVVHMETGYRDDYKIKIISRKDSPLSSSELLQELKEYGRTHNFLKGKKIDPNCNFIKFDKVYTWDDVVFPDEIKDDIRKNLLNLIGSRDIYKANGLQVKRGLIFSGAPGCGKTQTFKVLCNQVDWTVLWVSPKHLERGAKTIANIVTLAKELAPTIMLLEDIDLYGSSRETNHNPSLLGEMMNQLDGVQDNTDIITIATTNNKEVLEKALLDRPGRFDKVIDFPKPNSADRLKMVKVFSNGLIDESLPFFTKVAKEYTKNMTGAEVRELINMAIILAVDSKAFNAKTNKLELKETHFDEAFKGVKKKDFKKAIGINTARSSIHNMLDDLDD